MAAVTPRRLQNESLARRLRSARSPRSIYVALAETSDSDVSGRGRQAAGRKCHQLWSPGPPVWDGRPVASQTPSGSSSSLRKIPSRRLSITVFGWQAGCSALSPFERGSSRWRPACGLPHPCTAPPAHPRPPAPLHHGRSICESIGPALVWPKSEDGWHLPEEPSVPRPSSVCSLPGAR